MVNNENKSALRKQYRKERADRFISESWLHILSANEFKDVSKIGSYISYEFEPETSDINQRIIFSGKTLYLPRLLKNNDLEWVRWDGDKSKLEKSGKTLEPVGQAVEDLDLDVIILPALHVDRTGNRLGQFIVPAGAGVLAAGSGTGAVFIALSILLASTFLAPSKMSS